MLLVYFLKILYALLAIFFLSFALILTANDRIKQWLKKEVLSVVVLISNNRLERFGFSKYLITFIEIFSKLSIPIVLLSTVTSIPIQYDSFSTIQDKLKNNFVIVILATEFIVVAINFAYYLRIADRLNSLFIYAMAYFLIFLIINFCAAILDIIFVAISTFLSDEINLKQYTLLYSAYAYLAILLLLWFNLVVIYAGCDALSRSAGILRRSLESIAGIFLISYIVGFQGGKILDFFIAIGFNGLLATVGTYYANGNLGLLKDEEKAVHYYSSAAALGYADGQYYLGKAYEDGKGGLIPDEKDAVKFYQLAADQGYADAEYQLGLAYEYGSGELNIDESKAIQFYRLAANQWNSDAQYELGKAYENGIGGLAQDANEAVRLYTLSANQGNDSAQVALGRAYDSGSGGLIKDEKEAVRLYKLAADSGNADAEFELGQANVSGRGGLTKDDTEAVRWYKLASDQGNASAQFALAQAYKEGCGGLDKDELEAVRLYKLASDQGNPKAQFELAQIYKDGQAGLAKNVQEAYRLFNLAAEQGYEPAIEYLKNSSSL